MEKLNRDHVSKTQPKFSDSYFRREAVDFHAKSPRFTEGLRLPKMSQLVVMGLAMIVVTLAWVWILSTKTGDSSTGVFRWNADPLLAKTSEIGHVILPDPFGSGTSAGSRFCLESASERAVATVVGDPVRELGGHLVDFPVTIDCRSCFNKAPEEVRVSLMRRSLLDIGTRRLGQQQKQATVCELR
jgi:hypothetical protein